MSNRIFVIPSFEQISTVFLADQFEHRDFVVSKPMHLYNPVDKNGEGIDDPDAHLMSYSIKLFRKSCLDIPEVPEDKRLRACQTEEDCGGTSRETRYCKYLLTSKKQTNIRVDNQFGTIFMDTKVPDLLLVPSAKCIDNPPSSCEPMPDIPDNTNHFKCYKASLKKRICEKDPSISCRNDDHCGDSGPCHTGFTKEIVHLVDQFNEPKWYYLLSPSRLCMPVEKTVDNITTPIVEPDVNLMCYRVKHIRKVCENEPSKSCKKASNCGGNPCIPQLTHSRLTGVHINNQFGPLEVDTAGEDELCVPSTMTLTQ